MADADYESTGWAVPIKRIADTKDDKGNPTSPMFLTQQLASGTTAKGREFNLRAIIPDGSLLLEFKRKKGDDTSLGRDRFLVSVHDFVETLVDQLEPE